MPVQQSKSSLLAKLGPKLDNAVKKHAQDEPDYGFQKLPPGIVNGIAQIKEVKFDIYKSDPYRGQPYFRASGVVFEPEYVTVKGQQVKVRGQHTSVMEAICDTKTMDGKVTTQEEHVARILNHMRILGLDTSGVNSGVAMEEAAAALTQAAPFFKFSTSPRMDQKTGQETGVWENWYGNRGLEDYQPPEPGSNGEVVDHTGPGKSPDDYDPPNATGEEPSEELSSEPDLDALCAAATANDADAGNKLVEIALGLGYEKEAVDAIPSWDKLIEAIRAGGPAKEEPPETPAEPEKPWEPQKGDVYYYKPIDPKTKKPFVDAKTKKERKAIEVEVQSVNKRSKTVNCINGDDKKTVYSNVSWDDLQGEQ